MNTIMEGKENSDEKQIENVFTEESSEKQQALSSLPSYVKSCSSTQIESTTFDYYWKIDQFRLVCKTLDTLDSAQFPENRKYKIQMNIIRKSESPDEIKFVMPTFKDTGSCTEMKPPESLRAIQFYIRTNTPFTGSCTVINPPKSVLSKSVSGYIKDMTLLMEISDLDHIYTDTFIIRCKFEILHIVISNTIHMNLPSSTVYPKDETSEDSTFDQFESKNVNSIKFIIDKEQYVISKKLLYATNSSYFKNMCLTHNQVEKELTNELKSNNEVQAFKYLLLFILTGSIEEIQDNYRMLEQLLIIANKYDVSALKLTCEHYLLRHITIENAMKLVQLAFSSNAKYLESHSATFFKLYKNDIINTKEFRDLLPEDSDKIMELIENSRRCETSTPNFLFTSICEKY